MLLQSNGLGADLLRDRRRHRFVVGKLHGIGRPALSHRPQIRGIAEHLRQRDMSFDNLCGRPGIHTQNLASARADIPDDITHELFGHHHFHGHDRLKENRACLAHRILEGHGARDLEGDLRGVDVVITPV